MIEEVLSPGPGQVSTHPPFLVRKGQDIYLFYGRRDESPKGTPQHLQYNYKICYAVSQDGLHFRPNADPVIDTRPSVCRPWIIEWDGEYRMYFVRQLPHPPGPVRFRIRTATSKDLKKWDVNPWPLINAFEGRESIGSPCAMVIDSKVRMYFTAGKRRGQGDSVYVAESSDGVSFEFKKTPVYSPKTGTGYSASCYTPCIYQKGRRWKMLFSGCQKAESYRTFVCDSQDGTHFTQGQLSVDLASDPRFKYGAYKAVPFENHLYFVGTAEDLKTSIYRMPFSG